MSMNTSTTINTKNITYRDVLESQGVFMLQFSIIVMCNDMHLFSHVVMCYRGPSNHILSCRSRA